MESTIEITLGSIGVEVEVEISIDKGQRGNHDREEISRSVDFHSVYKRTEKGELVGLCPKTIIALGLDKEIQMILDEMLEDEKIG